MELDFNNVIELFEECFEKYKNKIMMINVEDDKKVSYTQLQDKSLIITKILFDLGLKKDDIVMMLLSNIPQFWYVYFGTIFAGGIISGINHESKKEELKNILNNCKPKVIFIESRFLSNFKDIENEIKQKPKIICIEDVDFETQRGLKQKLYQLLEEIKTNRGLDDSVSIFYSSGTTGLPKGVPISHRYVFVHKNIMVENIGFKEGERFLCVEPIYHIDHFLYFLTPFFAGGSCVITKKFSRKYFWKYINKYKINYVVGVPTMLSYLLNPPEDISKYDISSFKFFICGSAVLPLNIVKEFEKKFKVPVFDYFGSTETGLSTYGPFDVKKRKLGSTGKILDIMQLKIVDNNNELPPNKAGEMIIKGEHLPKGYYNNLVLTKEKIKNGWFHTGDLAYVDEENYLFIKGRITHMINKGGEKISPKEIDDVLHKHPKIKESVTIGVPNKHYGEEVKSYIVLKSNAKLTNDDILNYCQKHLQKFKCPRYIEFLKDIPKSHTGKYNIKKLKEMHKIYK